MSLADELLADLEEAGDEGDDGLYPEGDDIDSDGEATHGRTDRGLEDIPEEMEVDYSKAESVTSIAKLRNSKQVNINRSTNLGREQCIPLFMLGFAFSFQTLWTKFQTILESNVKTRMVSVTFKFPNSIMHLFQRWSRIVKLYGAIFVFS